MAPKKKYNKPTLRNIPPTSELVRKFQVSFLGRPFDHYERQANAAFMDHVLDVADKWEKKLMGNSPTAVLFFGYAFSEENAYPWENPDDYELNESRADWEPRDHFAKKVLGKNPDDLVWEEKKGIWDKLPVDVESWGFGENPFYYIFAKGTNTLASWDGPHVIDTSKFEEDKHRAELDLIHFAEIMKIDLKGQVPAWRLVVSYG